MSNRCRISNALAVCLPAYYTPGVEIIMPAEFYFVLPSESSMIMPIGSRRRPPPNAPSSSSSTSYPLPKDFGRELSQPRQLKAGDATHRHHNFIKGARRSRAMAAWLGKPGQPSETGHNMPPHCSLHICCTCTRDDRFCCFLLLGARCCPCCWRIRPNRA